MLLIDELLTIRQCENVEAEQWARFKPRLQQAQKFSLAPDFAATAEQLAMDYDVIAGAVPYCRLPFADTWFELVQRDRPRYHSAPIHVPGIQGVPHRIGFLLSAQDKGLSQFKAHQFWTIASLPEPKASHVAMTFDPTRGIGVEDMPDEATKAKTIFKIDTCPSWVKAKPASRGQLNAIIRPDITDYRTVLDDMHPSYSLQDTVFQQFLAELGFADWSGESIYILAVLALINTLNATESKSVDLAKLNKARSKRRDPPLANHYVLTVSTRLKNRVVGGAGSSNDGHANLRNHMVKGHFKVRKTGIFFWRPHARGDKQRGIIEKTYHLT